jgi:hypothetical protein
MSLVFFLMLSALTLFPFDFIVRTGGLAWELRSLLWSRGSPISLDGALRAPVARLWLPPSSGAKWTLVAGAPSHRICGSHRPPANWMRSVRTFFQKERLYPEARRLACLGLYSSILWTGL